MGHRDLIDNLLYSIAASQDIKFLTIDEKLKNFIKKHADIFISPSDI
jgi:PIN domain nuclease of toxin-antitoxin system